MKNADWLILMSVLIIVSFVIGFSAGENLMGYRVWIYNPNRPMRPLGDKNYSYTLISQTPTTNTNGTRITVFLVRRLDGELGQFYTMQKPLDPQPKMIKISNGTVFSLEMEEAQKIPGNDPYSGM